VSELSRGAELAWRIAAAETAGTRRPMIDRPQLLLGLLSLGKALGAAQELEPIERRELEAEAASIERLLARLGLQAVTLRRAVRQRVGMGATRHPQGAAISRTEPCKAAFTRAAEAAGVAPVSSVHLLAALFEHPDPHLDLLLRDAGVRPDELAREARLSSLLGRVAAGARDRHGVEIAFEANAEALLSEQGRNGDLEGTVERLVAEPLADLAQSGKLARHQRWRVAYDQGGIYMTPAE
jgi:hypothetical protein